MGSEIKRDDKVVEIPFGVKVFLGAVGLLVLAVVLVVFTSVGGWLATL